MKKVITFFFLLLIGFNQIDVADVFSQFAKIYHGDKNGIEKNLAEEAGTAKENNNEEGDFDEKFFHPLPDFEIVATPCFTDLSETITNFHLHPYHEDDIQPPELISA